MIRRPPRSTLSSSSAASDVYKRQVEVLRPEEGHAGERLAPSRHGARGGAALLLREPHTGRDVRIEHWRLAVASHVPGRPHTGGHSQLLVHGQTSVTVQFHARHEVGRRLDPDAHHDQVGLQRDAVIQLDRPYRRVPDEPRHPTAQGEPCAVLGVACRYHASDLLAQDAFEGYGLRPYDRHLEAAPDQTGRDFHADETRADTTARRALPA